MLRSNRCCASRLAALCLPLALFCAASLPSCQNPIAQKAEALQAKAVSPVLTLSPTGGAALASGASLDFGLISLGSSCDIVLDIANSGPSSLVIDLSKISIVPDASTKAGAFALSSPPPAEIASGGSASLKLSFSPDSAGAKTATITIPTNDVEIPVYSITMKGTGWAVVLATSAATIIAQTTATSGGNITDDGGWSIVDRGIAWGTSQNPTLAASKASDGGSGTGLYSCLMTNLTPGTLYYVRAYASNGITTGYGSQVSFTTLPATPSAPAVFSSGIKQLTANWPSIGGASSYDVYYSTSNTSSGATGPLNVAGTAITTSASFAVPYDGTTYYVWVAARNVSGTSPLSVSGNCTMAGSVSLAPTSTTIHTGNTGTLAPTISPSSTTNQNVSWTSSNTDVATVSSSGVVSAINPGSTIITVTTADQSKTATCAVTVSSTIRIFVGSAISTGSGFSGDGGLATSALISGPQTIALDASGNVYFADVGNQRIRKIDTSGIITTVAGNGVYGFSGDGGPATSARLNYPQAVAVDSSGNLYIADRDNQRIRKVDASTGFISTIGSVFPVSSALHGIAVDGSGNIYVAATGANYIYKVTSTGTVTTFAGTGTESFSGDNGPATSATLSSPYGVSVNSAGDVFIADSGNQRVRKVDHATLKITTVAGNGTNENLSGVPALSTGLNYGPDGVAVDSIGNIYISGGGYIKKVDHATTDITNYAGNGGSGSSGDGGDPVSASFSAWGLAVNPAGTTLYIDDSTYNRIWRIH